MRDNNCSPHGDRYFIVNSTHALLRVRTRVRVIWIFSGLYE